MWTICDIDYSLLVKSEINVLCILATSLNIHCIKLVYFCWLIHKNKKINLKNWIGYSKYMSANKILNCYYFNHWANTMLTFNLYSNVNTHSNPSSIHVTMIIIPHRFLTFSQILSDSNLQNYLCLPHKTRTLSTLPLSHTATDSIRPKSY